MAERSRRQAARAAEIGSEAPLSTRAEARSAKERAALAELVEVERAIAALEGRNVEDAEQMMMLRRDAERRRANLERIIAESHAELDRRRRRLPWKIVGGLVLVAAAAGAGVLGTRVVRARLAERERAVKAAEQVAGPFGARFRTAQTAVGAGALTVTVDSGKCFVAVAAGTFGAARVRVERQGSTREAAGSVGWCSCKSEEVQIEASGGEPLAVLLLEAGASAIGGADLLATVAPAPGASFAETIDRGCAEAAFDAWASGSPAAGRAPETLTREEKGFVDAGLAAVALGSDALPFVLPPAASDTCWLALGRGGQPLSLRRSGGERPLAAKWGALGFCAKDATGLSVWREGGGEVVVLAAPRARVGGLLGLREAAERAAVPIALWTAADELESDAQAALTASGIGTAPPGFAAKRGAVLAISTDARSMLAAGDLGRGVACRPALVVGAQQALCVEATAGAFQPVGGLPTAVAQQPRPLWLVPAPSPDPAEMERALELLAFARRLSARGFELTSLVGATLTRDGATVSGRSGEKEIAAVVVSATPPFLHTLSAGAPWKLADPRFTPLAPTAVVKLKATPPFAPGAAKREFVVWRR